MTLLVLADSILTIWALNYGAYILLGENYEDHKHFLYGKN
jgi:hypothetical protein